MHHQHHVSPGSCPGEKNCDALRFPWWPNGNTTKQRRCCCMQVHLFVATPSPSSATYALNRTAGDGAPLFEPVVVLTFKRNSYVDTWLKPISTEEGSVKLALDPCDALSSDHALSRNRNMYRTKSSLRLK